MILLIGFLVQRAYIWRDYGPFFRPRTLGAVAKLVVTVAFISPPSGQDGPGDLIHLRGKAYLVDKPENQNLQELVRIYPLPAKLINDSVTQEKNLINLASHVSTLLPKSSVLPQYPEPTSALILLGSSEGKRYPKLCSKDAKIFTQYATVLGYKTRLLQLHQHIAASVYNPEKNKWQMYDPHWGCAPTLNGNLLSAPEAFDLYMQGKDFDYCGPKEVFKTVVIIPNTLFGSEFPRWHYFNYDNLSYWRPVKISGNSDPFWKK